MSRQNCAIVLGGIASHIPLIQKLQQYGYFVLLVDYLDDPPAKRFADEHVQISTFDEQGIYDLAKRVEAKVIVNCCIEHLNPIVSRVSEELDLPVLYSSGIAVNVSEKRQMKRLLIENGIPTSKYVALDSLDEDALRELSFPMFAKPADGSGSNGVSRVENYDELLVAFEQANTFSKSKHIIVEEEAQGQECNVYCYVLEGRAKVLLVSAKYSEIYSKSHKNTKCIGTYAPANIGSIAQEKIRDAAQGIADGFGLSSTPMFIQLMVNEDDISVIEFACRIPGGYSYRSIFNKFGFDYFDFTLKVLLNESPDCNLVDTGEISIVHSFYANPCTLSSVEGVEELVQDGTIVDVNLARKPGDVISDESGNREKVGHFVISAMAPEEAIQKVDRFFEFVRVLNTHGENVLRCDLKLSLKDIDN